MCLETRPWPTEADFSLGLNLSTVFVREVPPREEGEKRKQFPPTERINSDNNATAADGVRAELLELGRKEFVLSHPPI